MFRRFYPYNHAASPFVIDYRKLYDKGFRGIIFDIDNTLVHHGDDPTEQTDKLLRDLKNIGFSVFILSNNSSERIGSFLRNVDLPYISEAGKPDPRNYKEAARLMGLEISETVFIGDQIFTDILGANRCGMPSILVDYIKADNERKIGKKRQLEKIILRFYRKNGPMYQRLGDITVPELK